MGQSFRTHDDIYNDWSSIVQIMAVHTKLTDFGGPGHWADPGIYIHIHTPFMDQKLRISC